MASAHLTTLTPLTDADVLALCAVAMQAARAGDCAKALDLMSPLWVGVGAEPNAAGLGFRAGAELYHCAGMITSVVEQSAVAQRWARRVLRRSARSFLALGDERGVVRSAHEVAASYHRSGHNRHARRVARMYHAKAKCAEPEDEAGLILIHAIAEWCLNRPAEALQVLTDAFALFEGLEDDRLKGSFHCTLASAYHDLGAARYGREYFRLAVFEFTAAIYHIERAGGSLHLSTLENNIGYLLSLLGEHDDALTHLDRAREISISLRDDTQAARVEITRAQVLAASGRLDEAVRVISSAVDALQWLGAESLLTEARAVEQDIARRRARAVDNVIPFGRPPARLPEQYTLAVTDDALVNAGIAAGDEVWLRRASAAQDGDLVYASTPDGMTLAFYFEDGEEVSLVFAHNGCRPRHYARPLFRVRGVVLRR
jgi:SOS-response transcriptional repressor LexA